MDILILGFIFCFSGLVQSILGFGLGLIALPLLLAHGLSLSQAVLLVAISSGLQTITTCFLLREHTPWKIVFKAVLIRSTMIYFGIEILARINLLPISQVKQIFGIILLSIITLKFIPRKKNEGKLKNYWSYIAFISSGLIAGAFGMGGPPLVIWANSTNWEQRKIRAFLLSTFALSLPFSVCFLLLKFPNETKPMLERCLYAIPFLIVGIIIGLKVGNKVSTDIFKKITFLFLTLMSIVFILKPLI